MSTYSQDNRAKACTNTAIDELSLNMAKLLISAGFFLRSSEALAEALPVDMHPNAEKRNPSGVTACHANRPDFLSHKSDAPGYINGWRTTAIRRRLRG